MLCSRAARAQALLNDPRLDLLTGSLLSNTRVFIASQEEQLQAAIETALRTSYSLTMWAKLSLTPSPNSHLVQPLWTIQ